MRTAVLRVGGAPPLRVWVADSEAEQRVGLQGMWRALDDGEGMYFPLPGGLANFAMLSVVFPIDIIFFDSVARVELIVTDVQPGDPRVWRALSSGVLEVRGGWARDYGVRVGDPLVASIPVGDPRF